jgi:hypothetical protein
MLVIEVAVPHRSDDRYEFECRVRVRRTPVQRLLGRKPPPEQVGHHRIPGRIRFGFRSPTRPIEHHPVWDAIYPLFFLTRNGGPVFDTGHRQAIIRSSSSVPAVVRDFYVKRASDMGIELTVEAPESDVRFEGSASDRDVLAFGGGKDSRALLGMLRELGRDPVVATSGASNAPDLPHAIVSDAIDGALADRLMAALMLRGRYLYVGGGLGEAHHVTPWQRYYDVCSPRPMAAMSQMLGSVGIRTELRVPLAILPYNITQRIVFERYPDLYRHQVSVPDGHHSEKNLHVSLCRYHHRIPLGPQCPDELFRTLLDEFVTRQLGQPQPFGARGHREGFHREMRAIIHRHRDDRLFAGIRARVPDEWAGDWIDYVHTYVDPAPHPAGPRDICLQYAAPIDAAPAGARLWRIDP